MPLNPKHICSLGRHLILLHPDLPTIIHAYFSTNSYYMEVAESLVGIVEFVGSGTVCGGRIHSRKG